MPRDPEVGIPKDARVMPVKVELLKMEAPERYVSSIAKKLTAYIMAKLIPLSLDGKALVVIMPAPRLVGPVMKCSSNWVVVAVVPVRNAPSSSNTPFETAMLTEPRGEEGKFNDPVPSITRLPPDS